MLRSRSRWLGQLVLAAATFACKDATSPTTGTLELNLVTTGADLDPDGFVLTLDGGANRVIPANGVARYALGPGSHILAIGGPAFNCDVSPEFLEPIITAGTTTRVEVRGSCSTYLRGAIVYTSQEFGPSEVMVMRAGGARPTRLTTDRQGYAAPAISPDGQSIAVAPYGRGSWTGIYLLDRFGGGRRKLVSRSAFDGSPSWSPDGTKLAFRSVLPGGPYPFDEHGRLFIVNRDGTGLRQLTPETTPDSSDDDPSWSPDGTRLIFSRSGALYVINADGTGLTSLGLSGRYPSWSPDGGRIAYTAFVDQMAAVFVAGSDGANPRQLRTPALGDQLARWSPDGRWLAFQRPHRGGFQIYRVDVDGRNEFRLSGEAGSAEWPSWSPTF
jgi:Tol biopolymer transport system component